MVILSPTEDSILKFPSKSEDTPFEVFRLTTVAPGRGAPLSSVITPVTVFNCAQLKTVTGVITDESGAPLPGATVVNLNTSNGVSSDFDGNFSIESSVGESITISYVGYADQTVQIGEEDSYTILLVSGNSLDEVVVTSLGITRDKKSLGYAVQELSGEDFQDVKALNPIESLSGEIAGLDIQSYNTMGGSANVIVREQ